MLPFIKTPPRIPELLFAAVLIWMFVTGQGWSVMLSDGDTGLHIRLGESILATGSALHHDPYSFGSAEHPYFAWEWLSDVLFAVLFRHGGLKAVTLFAALRSPHPFLCFCGICSGEALAFRSHSRWRS